MPGSSKKLSSCVRPGVLEVRASAVLADERVDQARLADVGAAGEGDLGAGRGRAGTRGPARS